MLRTSVAFAMLVASTIVAAQQSQTQPAPPSPPQVPVAPVVPASGQEPLAQILQNQGKIIAKIDYVEESVREARSDAKSALNRANDLERYLWLFASLGTVFFVSIVLYTRRELTKQSARLTANLSAEIRKNLADESKSQLAKIAENLAEKTRRSVKAMEDSHFRYMQITSLRHSKQYDDVLKYVSWRGDRSPFRGYPSPVQRSLIACLCNSNAARQSNEHLIAWEWSQDLVREDPSVENVIALIKTGNTLKHWDDAIEVYDKVSAGLSEDDKKRCEPYLFVSLRRSSDSERRDQNARRLKKIADSRKGSEDIKFITTLAAFYRDQGRFNDAEMVMKPHIRRLTGSSHLEDGWDKLFNTYLANCIDQGKPELGIEQARTMLTQNITPDLIFNCARVAWRLPEGNGQRSEIIDVIRKRYSDGYMPLRDDGTVKTLAILHEIKEEQVDAVSGLERSIDELREESGRWAIYQRYYYECMLAEIYLARRDADSVEKAITLLEDPVSGDRIGEAAYLIAKAFALRGEHSMLKKYLGRAGAIQRKWVMKARHDVAFETFPELDELLSDYVGV